MKLFDKKLHICETCLKNLYKNKSQCQTACNKMVLDPIPDELKDLKKIEKVSISNRILFKKIAIMYGKGEFCKIKASNCHIAIETENIWNILPRPTVSNRLIVVKLKRDLKYRGHIYFEQVWPHTAYQALTYLKSYTKFYDDISIAKGLSSEKMFKFSDIVEIQWQSECFWWKRNDWKYK